MSVSTAVSGQHVRKMLGTRKPFSFLTPFTLNHYQFTYLFTDNGT